MDILNLLAEKLDSLDSKVSLISSSFDDHIQKEEKFWKDAFPGGDARAHGDWHIRTQEKEKDRKELWKVIRNWAIIAFLAFLTGTLASYIATGFWAEARMRVAQTQ